MGSTDRTLAPIEAASAGNQRVPVEGMEGLPGVLVVPNQHLAMIAELLGCEFEDGPTVAELLAEVVGRSEARARPWCTSMPVL